MQNKNIIIVILSLVLVLGIGYVAGFSQGDYRGGYVKKGNSHMMPDGSLMNNEDTGMHAMMSSMNMNLEGKTGDDFDRAFLSEMIVHHEGAVEMAEAALLNAKHEEIKNLAKAIISAQNKEIADMKAWEKAWYGR